MIDFFLVGPPKAGTSSLYRALDGHEGVYFSERKEPKHYMSARPRQGLRHSRHDKIWKSYTLSQDDYRALYSSRPLSARVGDATPYYLAETLEHTRMASENPGAVAIAVLRDPLLRAFSHFEYNRSHAYETATSFSKAIELEGDRRRSGWPPDFYYSHLSTYGESLESLCRAFGPERTMVIQFEELLRSPDRILQQIQEFIGVSPQVKLHLPHDNATKPVRPGRLTPILGAAIAVGRQRLADHLGIRTRTVLSNAAFALYRSNSPRAVPPIEYAQRFSSVLRPDAAQTVARWGLDPTLWPTLAGHFARE